jgi:putative metallohydrolase (TIGR04338 family)
MLYHILFLLAFQDDHPQVMRLYHAEKLLVNSDPQIQIIKFNDIHEFVAKVYNDPWVKQRYKNPKMPHIERSKHGNIGYCSGNTLGFPPIATNIVVLHEIAHHLTPKEHHGPRFARVLVDLVWKFMGQESADRLRNLYTKENVSWNQRPNGK